MWSSAICSRCSRDIREKSPDRVVTGAVCNRCVEDVLIGTVSLEDLVNCLMEPILIINQPLEVIGGSWMSSIQLNQTEDKLQGQIGEVINCVSAIDEQTCGNEIECQHCRIITAIAHTEETGEPVINVATTKLLNTPDGEISMKIILSTEKLSQNILLRLDKIEPV